MLLAAEVDLKAIQEWLGHSSYATTANIYTHLHSKSKENAMDKLTGKLNICRGTMMLSQLKKTKLNMN